MHTNRLKLGIAFWAGMTSSITSAIENVVSWLALWGIVRHAHKTHGRSDDQTSFWCLNVS